MTMDEYALDCRVREIDYDVYTQLQYCNRISDYIFVLTLRNGERLVYNGYYDCLCDYTEDNYKYITPENNGETFSSNLRYIMFEKQVSVLDLSRMTRKKASVIQKYVNGTHIPSYSDLQKLARVLDCSISDLTNEPNESNEP